MPRSTRKRELADESRELIDSWPELKRRYAQDEVRFGVRDKGAPKVLDLLAGVEGMATAVPVAKAIRLAESEQGDPRCPRSAKNSG